MNNYPGSSQVAYGVFITPGDAVYITDNEGEIASWNADEVAEDGEAFTAALFAVVLAVARGPGAVRQNIEDKGQTLRSFLEGA